MEIWSHRRVKDPAPYQDTFKIFQACCMNQTCPIKGCTGEYEELERKDNIQRGIRKYHGLKLPPKCLVLNANLPDKSVITYPQ